METGFGPEEDIIGTRGIGTKQDLAGNGTGVAGRVMEVAGDGIKDTGNNFNLPIRAGFGRQALSFDQSHLLASPGWSRRMLSVNGDLARPSTYAEVAAVAVGHRPSSKRPAG